MTHLTNTRNGFFDDGQRTSETELLTSKELFSGSFPYLGVGC